MPEPLSRDPGRRVLLVTPADADRRPQRPEVGGAFFPSAGFLTRRTHTRCARRGGVHSLPINLDSDYVLPRASSLEAFLLPYGLQLRVQFRLDLVAR